MECLIYLENKQVLQVYYQTCLWHFECNMYYFICRAIFSKMRDKEKAFVEYLTDMFKYVSICSKLNLV